MRWRKHRTEQAGVAAAGIQLLWRGASLVSSSADPMVRCKLHYAHGRVHNTNFVTCLGRAGKCVVKWLEWYYILNYVTRTRKGSF